MNALYLLLGLAAVAYFVVVALLNPGASVEFHPFFGKTLSGVSLPLLLLASFGAGIALAFLAVVIRDSRRAFRSWLEGRGLRKAEISNELYQEGLESFLKGQFERAEKNFGRALEKNVSNLKAYLGLAEVHHRMGNHRKAIETLSRARLFEPTNLELLFLLVECHRAAEDLEAAVEVARRILELDAENPEGLRRLRDLHVAREQWEAAYRVQKQVMHLAKGEDYARERKRTGELKYGYALELLSAKAPDKAARKLHDVLKLHPDFVPALVTLGDIRREGGDRDGAAHEWEAAYDRTRHAAFLIRLEETFLTAEEPARILRFYRRRLEQSPDDLLARLFYAKLNLRLELVDEAIAQLQKLESSGVENDWTHLLVAEAHARRGRLDEAVRSYRAALGIDRRVIIPFHCSGCGRESSPWRAHCPGCGRWASYGITVAGGATPAPAPTAPLPPEWVP